MVSTGRWSRAHYFSLSYIANTIKCFLIAITTIITLKCNLILCITGYLSMQSLEDIAWKRLSSNDFSFLWKLPYATRSKVGNQSSGPVWVLKHWVFICVYNVTFIGPKVGGTCFVAPSRPHLSLTFINVFLKALMNLSHNHTNIVSHGMGTHSKITRLHALAVATLPQRGWLVDVSRMHQADTTTADLMSAHVHSCGFVAAAV